MIQKFVAYRRVSTSKQGQSGLGLEAQDAAIKAHVGDSMVIASYTEIESGKRADRPELLKAIAHARRSKATLVIAKLDRLARNVAFTASLMDSGVDFVACDNPHANRLTIHILAAVAEDEARRISQRTKDALAAAKARGTRLGTNNLTAAGRTRGARRSGEVARTLADESYADLAPAVKALQTEGLSLRQIAARLNGQGHTTRQGRPWNPTQVSRVLGRLTMSALPTPP